MEKDISLYEYLANILRMQIVVGQYHTRDFLPPVKQLCGQFRVGSNTVKRALQLLVEQGLVALDANRRFEVIYNSHNPESERSRIQELLSRKNAILEMYDALAILMPSCFAQGALLCNDSDLEYLFEMVEKIDTWRLPFSEINQIISSFQLFLIAKLQNSILSDFYRQANLFVFIPRRKSPRYPHPFDNSFLFAYPYLSETLNLIRSKKFGLLQTRFQNEFLERKVLVTQYLELLHSEEENAAAQIPFAWLADRAKEQFSSRIAMKLIAAIHQGNYWDGALLPTIAETAAQYDVAQVTIRRAYSILNEIGLACTINGVGTRITLNQNETAQVIVSRPVIRENLRFYMQAFQIILLTIQDVSAQLSLQTNAEELEAVTLQLQNKESISSVLLNWFAGRIPNPSLQEIYRQLLYFSVYEYYMYSSKQREATAALLQKKSLDTLQALREDNQMLFTRLLSELVRYAFESAKELLIQCGLEEMKGIPTPLPLPSVPN